MGVGVDALKIGERSRGVVPESVGVGEDLSKGETREGWEGWEGGGRGFEETHRCWRSREGGWNRFTSLGYFRLHIPFPSLVTTISLNPYQAMSPFPYVGVSM